MPIPNLLVLNAFGSLPLQMHELQGGVSTVQIGSDLGGTNQVYVPSEAIKGNHGNFCKTFKGERYCLTISTVTGQVRRENEGGAGAWGVVFTHSVTGSFNGPEYFLHVVKDGSDIALVMGFACATTHNFASAKSNTGQLGSWSEFNVNLAFVMRMASSSVVFRNRIYWADPISVTNPTKVMEFDPSAGSLTTISAPWIAIAPGFSSVDFCVAFDKLWAIAVDNPNGGTSRLRLYEFTGGGWSANSILGTAGQADFGAGMSGKYCLWTDNTNLYCVGYTEKNDNDVDSRTGSTVWEGVPSGSTFVWTQNDTTMIASLRPNVRPSVDATRQDRWSIFVDNDTDPANPAYYLIVAEGPAPGTGHAIYLWNGFGVEMGPGPGASVSIAFSLPEQKTGGGEAISQGPATYGEIEVETPIAGAYRLSYRTPGTQGPYTGRVYFSIGQGPPDTLATLIGGGTTFGPITGDNRSTLRTVDVDLGLSGVTGPDPSNWLIDLR